MIKKINQCRICGNKKLIEVLDLGDQYLTSIFPSGKQRSSIKKYPLKLVKCHGGTKYCNLVQLKHSVEKKLMYSNDYGYRSGLNKSMVEHLRHRVEKIKKIVKLDANDVVIDIGSNDGTTLSFYEKKNLKIGIDPTAKKFKKFYNKDIKIIDSFFSSEIIKNHLKEKQAKVITSFAMFYDLDSPLIFAKQIAEILDKNFGIWVLEQSYLPEMLKKLSFDTVCHEHLEYYSLIQIDWIMKKAGLRIIDVEFNNVNGGSFAVTVCHKNSKLKPAPLKILKILQHEKNIGLLNLKIFKDFSQDVLNFKKNLRNFLLKKKKDGQKIFGLGASTKGNVILQYCNIKEDILPLIGEVNPEKFNKFTPGSSIKIINENDILKMKPDLLLILPWHFKDFFINSQKYKKFNLLFPLPKIHIVKKK